MPKVRIEFEADNIVADDTDIVERFRELVTVCLRDGLEIRKAACEVGPTKSERDAARS